MWMPSLPHRYTQDKATGFGPTRYRCAGAPLGFAVAIISIPFPVAGRQRAAAGCTGSCRREVRERVMFERFEEQGKEVAA